MPVLTTEIVNNQNINVTFGYPAFPTLVKLQDETNHVRIEFLVNSMSVLPASGSPAPGTGGGPNNVASGAGAIIRCYFVTTSQTFASPTAAVEFLQQGADMYQNYLPFTYAGEAKTYRTKEITVAGPNLYVWFDVPSTVTVNTTLSVWTVERSTVNAVSII